MGDIGGGGFEGFTDLTQPSTTQWGWTPGGHGAPLNTEDRITNIAAYITSGSSPRPADLLDSPNGPLSLLSRLAPYALPLSVLVIGALAVALALAGTWWPLVLAVTVIVLLQFV